MIRLLLLMLCAYFPFPTSAQLIDKKIETFVEQQKVDTFMVYSFPCSGEILLDSCGYEEPRYLFWKFENNYYLKRFEYCKTYKLIQIDSINPLRFYLTYKRIIDHEKIKPPTCYVFKHVKNKIDTLIESSSVDHSCYHTFLLNIGKQSLTKYADVYDLDFVKFDDGRKNIFFVYNNRTKLKSLVDQTKECLKEFETGGKYVLE
jgi:hypothetical protein